MPTDGIPTATVFVVDDQPIIAETLAMILKAQGFEAKPFCEPHEALQAARLEPPDLLISDVEMPGMSGVDLAIHVEEDCPGCKVLLFSGQAVTCDLLAAAEARGHHLDLMLKPIHPHEFLAKIQETLGQVA